MCMGMSNHGYAQYQPKRRLEKFAAKINAIRPRSKDGSISFSVSATAALGGLF